MKANYKQSASEAIEIVSPTQKLHVDPASAAAILKACEKTAPSGRLYAYKKNNVITLVNEPADTPHEGCKVYIKQFAEGRKT